MSNGEDRAYAALARVVLERHPGDAARIFESTPDEETVRFLAGEPASRVLPSFDALTPDRAARVLATMEVGAAARLLQLMEPQRAASLAARMDQEPREERLRALPETLAAEIRELASYGPETAGALMDPRVTSFPQEATVRDVVRRLRTFRNRRIRDVFLVDSEGRLAGLVTLVDVVLASTGEKLANLRRDTPSVRATSSKEEVVELLETHRVGSVPVVGFDGRLLGVLRQEQLVTAAQEEATAAAVRMVGASEDERALSPPFFAVRKRLPWLQVNLLTAFLAASVVGIFEQTIAKVTALAVLLPVVAGQSGNTGSQALAVTMRGLALREVRTRHWLRVASKEVLAGMGNGIAVALTTAAAVYLWSSSPGLSLVIGVSMVISMTLAGLSGAVIPMLLTALRQDPAQSSSIILTTVTDVVGFFSFLGIATLLTGMLTDLQ
jgi:magnesium transporter